MLRKRSFDLDVADERSTSKTWHSQSLAKRQFGRVDLSASGMDTYLVRRFNGEGIILVLTSQTQGNSAEFERFVEDDGTDAPFQMGLEGLCGCTIVVVVSKQAVWFAHLL